MIHLHIGTQSDIPNTHTHPCLLRLWVLIMKQERNGKEKSLKIFYKKIFKCVYFYILSSAIPFDLGILSRHSRS